MRDSNWHEEIQAQYRGYTIAQLEWVRDDAGAAAKVATGIKQNDYLDMSGAGDATASSTTTDRYAAMSSAEPCHAPKP